MNKNENIILSLEEIKLLTPKERLSLVLQKKVDDENIGHMKFLPEKGNLKKELIIKQFL